MALGVGAEAAPGAESGCSPSSAPALLGLCEAQEPRGLGNSSHVRVENDTSCDRLSRASPPPGPGLPLTTLPSHCGNSHSAPTVRKSLTNCDGKANLGLIHSLVNLGMDEGFQTEQIKTLDTPLNLNLNLGLFLSISVSLVDFGTYF